MMILASGNQAVAEAARLARVQVVAAYPITPQTSIIERIAELVGKGELAADYVTVESEHSAMAASIGASLAGARAFTATSSQGLALMHELLHWAAGQRAPIVMANVNRALAPPWSVWADHTDSMSQRDTGWLQLHASTNQEALDATLLAFRAAEDPDVSLPAMVNLDGFLLSHTYMPVDVPAQDVVDAFLPPYAPRARIEPGTTQLFGSFSPPDLAYTEFRRDIERGMLAAKSRLARAADDLSRATGRPAWRAVEEYRLDDAEVALVVAGSLAETAREAVDRARKEGVRAGLARVSLFRPFPAEELVAIARAVPTLGVIDRSFSFGNAGPLATETRAALYDAPDAPRVAGFVAGLGGRDVTPDDLARVIGRLARGEAPRDEWLSLKEAK